MIVSSRTRLKLERSGTAVVHYDDGQRIRSSNSETERKLCGTRTEHKGNGTERRTPKRGYQNPLRTRFLLKFHEPFVVSTVAAVFHTARSIHCSHECFLAGCQTKTSLREDLTQMPSKRPDWWITTGRVSVATIDRFFTRAKSSRTFGDPA